MARVSVIIPVYKVEKYIKQCVDSVLNQSFRDIEIILVDDGSPDDCGSICDSYAETDERVRVIHQKNMGLSAARNAGIEAAVGEYLMFVDSDDWVEQNFCKVPYELAEAHGADLVMFCSTERLQNCGMPADGIKTEEEALWIIATPCGVGVAAWNKLYHRSIFESIRYPVGRYYEDSAVIADVIHTAKRIYYSKAQLYNYRHRRGSITMSRNEKVCTDHYEMTMLRAESMRKLGYSEVSAIVAEKAMWKYILNYGSKGEHSREFIQYFSELKAPPAFFGRRAAIMMKLIVKMPFMADFASAVKKIIR